MRKAEAWNKLTMKETGLAELQSEVLDILKIEDLSSETIEHFRQNCHEKTDRGLNEDDWYLEEIDGLECHQYMDYLYTGRPKKTSMNPLYFYTDFNEEGLPKSQTDLFETAGVLRDIVAHIVSSSDFDKYDTVDLEEKALLSHADLGNKKKIIIDNVQTLLEVYRVFVGDENDINIRNQVMNNMSSIPLEDNIVTDSETLLQVSARAPFFFWARARREVPFSFNGNPIRDGLQYNQDFLKYIVRGNVSKVPESEMTRSGGCPVAHKDFEHLDLINAFGQEFSALHRRMHITG